MRAIPTKNMNMKVTKSLKGPVQVLLFGLMLIGVCYILSNSDYKGDHLKFKGKVHKSIP